MNKPKKPNTVYKFLTKDNGKYLKYLAVFIIFAFIVFYISIGMLLNVQQGDWPFGGSLISG